MEDWAGVGWGVEWAVGEVVGVVVWLVGVREVGCRGEGEVEGGWGDRGEVRPERWVGGVGGGWGARHTPHASHPTRLSRAFPAYSTWRA